MESKYNEEIEKSQANLYEVSAKDCRISSVTVYQDRAEIVRTIEIAAPQSTGEQTIVLHSLTNETNPESIRVKGDKCAILEVSHELKRKSTITAPDTDTAVLKNDINQCVKDLKVLTQQIGQVAKERKLIQSYADTAMLKGKEQASLSLSDARELINFHTSEMIRLDNKESDLRDQSTLLDEALDSARRGLSKLTAPASSTTTSTQTTDHFSTSYVVSIVIELDAHTNTDILKLQFSYVVYNATWVPSYDLRINSVSNELSLSYFAEVEIEMACVPSYFLFSII